MSSMYPSFGGTPPRPCMRCGVSLSANETQCSRCGTYNPLPLGQQFSMPQPGAQGGGAGASGSLWNSQPLQAPRFPAAGNGAWSGNQNPSASTWGGGGQPGTWQQNSPFGEQNQPVRPSQPLQQNLFGSPNGSGFSTSSSAPFANFPQNPNQSAYSGNNAFGGADFQQSPVRPSLGTFLQATQQNQNGYGGASPMAPPRPPWMKKNDEDDEDEGKNRPSAGVVVIIVVLLIVLIGGGGYGGYYFWHHRNDGATSNTNGPAIVTPSITPLFGDSFKNNNNNWDTNPPQGAKVTLAGDGKLVLESDNNSLFPEMVPGGKVFGDLRIDVDAGLTSGDPKNGYGIYIRASSNQNNLLSLYYRFEVYGDGSFVVYKGFVDGNGKQQSTSLVESPPSDALNHAGPTLNHLTVIAKGQALTLIANGTTVANFSDVSYKSGVVALFVSNVQHVAPGAQATFENFAIFPAQ